MCMNAHSFAENRSAGPIGKLQLCFCRRAKPAGCSPGRRIGDLAAATQRRSFLPLPMPPAAGLVINLLSKYVINLEPFKSCFKSCSCIHAKFTAFKKFRILIFKITIMKSTVCMHALQRAAPFFLHSMPLAISVVDLDLNDDQSCACAGLEEEYHQHAALTCSALPVPGQCLFAFPS